LANPTISIIATLDQYALSCGLLLLPAAAWNIILAKRLPATFQPAEFARDIPASLAFAENGLRAAVFIVPFLMPLDITTPRAKWALLVYGAGTLLYFASWLALICLPKSSWSLCPFGFAAPAYTPLLWLLGISLLGDRLFWGEFYRWWMYFALCIAFLVAHFAHTLRVYFRNARCRAD
jgi:hypothetical protein